MINHNVSLKLLIIAALAMSMMTTTSLVYAQPGATSPGLLSGTPSSSPSTTTTTPTTPTTANVSAAAQQIIDTAQAECANAIQLGSDLESSTADLGFDFQAALAVSCIFIVYESASTIVLGGDLLINVSPGLYDENPFL